MASVSSLSTGILFEGVPHGYGETCACVACHALRRAADERLVDGPAVLRLRLLPRTPEGPQPEEEKEAARSGLGLTGLPPDFPTPKYIAKTVDPGAMAGARLMVFAGLWCSHDVMVGAVSEDVFHIKFGFTCEVKIEVMRQSQGGTGSLSTHSEIVSISIAAPAVPGLDAEAQFFEQWVSGAEASRLARRFRCAEEAVLRAGDIVWEQEGEGRTTLVACGPGANWRIGNDEYEVQAQSAEGVFVQWETRHVAAWVQARAVLERLPASMLNLGLWVRLCTTRFGDVLVVRLRRTGVPPDPPGRRARLHLRNGEPPRTASP